MVSRTKSALRLLRGKRTLREVAARSGYSIGYLSSAERGLYGLSDAAVTALARCYRATVDAVRAASDASLAGGRDA